MAALTYPTEWSDAAERLLHEAHGYAHSDYPALRARTSETLLEGILQALIHLAVRQDEAQRRS